MLFLDTPYYFVYIIDNITLDINYVTNTLCHIYSYRTSNFKATCLGNINDSGVGEESSAFSFFGACKSTLSGPGPVVQSQQWDALALI